MPSADHVSPGARGAAKWKTSLVHEGSLIVADKGHDGFSISLVVA